jgi:predicted DNA-binding antitoxin AbrB/MazE fold protein
MEKLEIEAVYEHGTLKLPRELPLQDGEKVTVTIHPTGSAVKRRGGRLPRRRPRHPVRPSLGRRSSWS